MGLKLGYEYDFGSTTYLELEVIGARVDVLGKERVELMACNVPPDDCCQCGQPAVIVCSFCMCKKDAWLCRKCANTHYCSEGQQGLTQVVNSPRVGVCGYPQSDLYFDTSGSRSVLW